MPASAVDATAVNSGGTKQLLANWVIKFLINFNLVNQKVNQKVYQEIHLIESS